MCQKVNHVRIFLMCTKPSYVPWDPREHISKLMTYTERVVSSVRSKIISMTWVCKCPKTYVHIFFITPVYPCMIGTKRSGHQSWIRSSPGYSIYISTQLYGAKQSMYFYYLLMYNLYVNVVQVCTRGIDNYDFVNLE